MAGRDGAFGLLTGVARRGLLALLLGISATTCAAPQDDTADVTPDPPNVAIADPPHTAVAMAPPPSVEAQTRCEWESGFRISPDSIGPLATTDPVGVVKELCPQARYEPAEDFPLMRTGAPAIVIPIPGGELSGTQPRRSSVEGLDVEQPVDVWHLTGDGTLPEGLSMKSTLGDLRMAYWGEDVYADIIDGRISTIGVFFWRVRGMAFLMENLDTSALVRQNAHGFSVLSSSVPDSATIRGVSVRGVTTPGVGRSFFPPACGQLYDLDSFEDHFRCAELGVPVAQTVVGGAYNRGLWDVPEDDPEAVHWYRLAAEQGNAPGQFNLGRMYANGEGVPEDLVYAYMWFDLSAAQGNRSGQRERDLIEQRMTREQIAEAQRLSREWMDAAIETAPSPSVEAPPPTQVSVPFPYRDSTEADVTGDGVPETLQLAASGQGPLDLFISFSVWSAGQEIYQTSWDSAEYFRYEIELVAMDDSIRYAHVRDQLDSFFDSSAFMVVPPAALNADHSRPPFDPPDMDNDPVKLISAQLLMPFLQDSLSAAGVDSAAVFRQAIGIAYRSGRVHPEAREIWDMMTAEELLTFRFNAGGEAKQRIAWSRTNSRFFYVWACC